jgi:hypothetical protein
MFPQTLLLAESLLLQKITEDPLDDRYSELKLYISELRAALFWDFAQRIMVVSYRRFGTTYRFHIQGTAIEDGTDNCTETSVRS